VNGSHFPLIIILPFPRRLRFCLVAIMAVLALANSFVCNLVQEWATIRDVACWEEAPNTMATLIHRQIANWRQPIPANRGSSIFALAALLAFYSPNYHGIQLWSVLYMPSTRESLRAS